MRFIGDIHGEEVEYRKIISRCDSSIQVGDFGIGFRNFNAIDPNHRFIRGNHDNPSLCQSHPNWIPDGNVEVIEEKTFMFVGGAKSIDKDYRTPGLDWWPEEELSTQALEVMIDLFCSVKPDVMVTHDFPDSVTNMLFKRYAESIPRTREAFDYMLDTHKPKLWIAGHWHRSRDTVIEGCRFICLDILEYIDL